MTFHRNWSIYHLGNLRSFCHVRLLVNLFELHKRSLLPKIIEKASVVLVMPREITHEPMTLFLDQSAITIISFDEGDGDMSSLCSVGTSLLNAFQKPRGVALLTCSLILSRGIMEVRADMDDSSTCHLTGLV